MKDLDTAVQAFAQAIQAGFEEAMAKWSEDARWPWRRYEYWSAMRRPIKWPDA